MSITTSKYHIEEIRQVLIQSCLTFNSKGFLPYLLAPNVKVSFPNKIRFYKYFVNTLKCAKLSTIGPLELKIEKESWEEDEEMFAYNFYDRVHQYPRINLQVREEKDGIWINVLPF